MSSFQANPSLPLSNDAECVIVLRLSNRGTLRKNCLSDGAWRRMSPANRLTTADVIGAVVDGIEIYRGVITREMLGCQLIVSSCVDAVEVSCSLAEVRDVISKYCGGRVVSTSFYDALVIKSFPVGPLYQCQPVNNIAIELGATQKLGSEFWHGPHDKWVQRIPSVEPFRFDRPPVVFAPVRSDLETSESLALRYRQQAEVVRKAVADVRPSIPHRHTCAACFVDYDHSHRGGESDHFERPKQCPNPVCCEFQGFDPVGPASTLAYPPLAPYSYPSSADVAVRCRCGAYRVNTAAAGERHRHECRFERASHLIRVKVCPLVADALSSGMTRGDILGMLFSGESVDCSTQTALEVIQAQSDVDPAQRPARLSPTRLGSLIGTDMTAPLNYIVDSIHEVRPIAIAAAHAVSASADTASTLLGEIQECVRGFRNTLSSLFGGLSTDSFLENRLIELCLIIADLFIRPLTELPHLLAVFARIFNFFGFLPDVMYKLFRGFRNGFIALVKALTPETHIVSTIDQHLPVPDPEDNFEDAREFEAQAAGPAPFIPLLTAIIGTITLGSIPSKTALRSATELSRAFTSFVPTVTHISDFFSHVLAFFPVCVKNWLSVICPPETFYQKLVSGSSFRTWVENVDLVCDPARSDELSKSVDLQDRALALQREGKKILCDAAVLMKDGEGSKLNILIVATCTKLDRVCRSIADFRATNGVRVTPFGLYLAGPPGFGKSTLASQFARLLATDPTLPMNEIMYSKGLSETWDSYRNQPFCLFDDLGQSAEQEDIREIIDIISNNQYVLPMASLDNPSIGVKGATFSSAVVIMCSNTAYPKGDKAITCQQAFLRRRHLLIRVCPRPEACMRNGDYLEPLRDKWKPDFSHLQFFVCHPVVQSEPDQGPYTYAQILKIVKDRAVAHFVAEEKIVVAKEADDVLSAARVVVSPGEEALLRVRDSILPGLRRRETIEAQGLSDDEMSDVATSVYEEASSDDEEGPIVLFSETDPLNDPGYSTFYATNPHLYYLKYDETNFGFVHVPVREGLPMNGFAKRYTQLCQKLDDIMKRSQKMSSVVVVPRNTPPVPPIRSEVPEISLVEQCAKIRQTQSVADSKAHSTNAKLLDDCAAAAKVRVDAFVNEHPRIALALKVAAAAAILGIPALIIWQAVKRRRATRSMPDAVREEASFVAESFQDRDKARRALNRKRQFVAEARHYLPPTSPLIRDVENVRSRIIRDLPLDASEIDRVRDAIIHHWHSDGVEVHRAEGSVDPSASSLVQSVVIPKLFQVNHDGAPSRMSMTGMRVCGRLALLPRHLFILNSRELIAEGTVLYITLADGQKYTSAFSRKSMRLFPRVRDESGVEIHKDMVLYDLGVRVPASRDVTNLFLDQKDLPYVANCSAQLAIFPPGSEHPGFIVIPSVKFAQTKVYTSPALVDSPDRPEDMVLVNGLEYEAATQPGYCGSVLVLENTKIVNKIMGLHVGGSMTRNFGFSEVITRESLITLVNSFEPQVNGTPVHPGLGSFDNARLVPESENITFNGTLPEILIPRAPTNTQIRESPLFEQICAHSTEPAPLVPSDPRLLEPTPMIKRGVEKFGRPAKPLDPELLAIATKSVFEELRSLLSGDKIEVWTEAEAINGIPQISHADPLDMSTAPGHPYNTVRPHGQTGKRFLFKQETDSSRPQGFKYVVNHPLLRSRLDKRQLLSSQAERLPESLWIPTLKDERRPIAKIAIGKTRTFIYAPVDITIQSRKYLGAFAASLFSHPNEGFSAPGLDTCSGDWDRLAKDLLSVSDVGFAGDYGNYDGTLMPEVIHAVGDIINRLYDDGPVNAMHRTILFDEYVHTQMLCGNTVFHCHTGNKSGNFLTTPINTVAGRILMTYAFLQLARQHAPEYADPIFYRKYVVAKFYGDDNINSVSRKIIAWFNMITVGHCLSSLGMEYTSPDKSSALVEFRPILDWTFLKAGFRKVGRNYVPLLDVNTIYELTNWVRKSNDDWKSCEENCADALKYAYFYGQEFFDDLRDRILVAADNLRHPFVLPSYDWFDRAFAEKYQLPNLAYGALGELDPYFEVRDAAKRQRIEAQSAVAAGIETAPNETNVEDAGLGISFRQASTPDHSTAIGPTSASTVADTNITDRLWSISNLVGKEVFVNSFLWSVGSSVKTILGQYNVPGDFIDPTSVNHAAFGQFAYARFKPIVRIQVNGTQFHTGTLIAYYVPLCTLPVLNSWHAESVTVMSGVQHALLDPAKSTIVEMELPFINPRHYLALRNPRQWDFLGSLQIAVFNELRAGTGTSTAVRVSVSVRFEDAQFKIPRPVGTSLDLHAQIRKLKEQLKAYETIEAQSSVAPVTLSPSAAAVTGRPFGEKMDSVLSILKRYQLVSVIPNPIFDTISGSPPTTFYTAIDISNLFFFPSGYVTGSLTNLPDEFYARRGMIGWFGAAYRASYGSVRFKLQHIQHIRQNYITGPGDAGSQIYRIERTFDGQDFSTHGFSTAQPPSISQDSFGVCFDSRASTVYSPANATRGSIHRAVASSAAPISDPEFAIAAYLDGIFHAGQQIRQSASSSQAYSVETYMQSGIAATWSDPAANYLFIEIPIQTPYKFIINNFEGSTDTSDANARTMGTLYIAFPAPSNNVVDFQQTTGYINLFVSAGDDYRLGVFVGVPGVALGRLNLANDLYQPSLTERIVAQGATYSTINNNIKKSAIRSMPIDVSGSTFKAADSIDVEAHAMDCPSINLSPMPLVRSPLGYFTSANDVVYNERLSLYPGDSITTKTPEDFGTTEDETTLKFWTKKWAREGRDDFTIQSTYTSGQLIYSRFVCPMALALANRYTLQNQYYVVPMDYASMKFNYWRGSILIRLDVIASAFHSCRLFVCYSIGSSATPTTLKDAMSCYGSYIDVNADSHSFEFSLPYESTLNALRVPNGILPVGGNYLDYTTGTFSIWVVNDLVAPAGVSTFVDCNIWIAGGDDYELFALGNNNATWINVPIAQNDPGQDVDNPNPLEPHPDPIVPPGPHVKHNTVGVRFAEQPTTDDEYSVVSEDVTSSRERLI